jgi:hypothetical protein
MIALTPREFSALDHAVPSYQTEINYLRHGSSAIFGGSDLLAARSQWVRDNIAGWVKRDHTDIRIVVREQDVIQPEWGPVIP